MPETIAKFLENKLDEPGDDSTVSINVLSLAATLRVASQLTQINETLIRIATTLEALRKENK